MKKFITIMLVLMMSLMLAACGDSNAAGQQQEPVTETEMSADQGADITDDVGNADSDGDIGHEKVKDIVLAKVPGAVEDSIYEFERETDDGRIEYEGSIYHDGYDYEFEVDGATGNILKWEIDD